MFSPYADTLPSPHEPGRQKVQLYQDAQNRVTEPNTRDKKSAKSSQNN